MIRLASGGYKASGIERGALTIKDIDSILAQLDVKLSTRLADNKFPAASALSDTLSNPSTTIVGTALLGWEPSGGVWKRLQCDTLGRLKVTF